MPVCGTDDENSPPPEGCRGGLTEPEVATPKATPSPAPWGDFKGTSYELLKRSHHS